MLLTIPIPDFQRAVRLSPGIVDGDEDGFFQFCQANTELRIERAVDGEIIVTSPAGGYASFQTLKVASELFMWASKNRSGIAFDSSGGFIQDDRRGIFDSFSSPGQNPITSSFGLVGILRLMPRSLFAATQALRSRSESGMVCCFPSTLRRNKPPRMV